MTVTRMSRRDCGVTNSAPTRPDPTPSYLVTFSSCRRLRNAGRRDGMMPLPEVAP